MKIILRLSDSVDVLVEEPIHPVVSVSIHRLCHVFFHDRFEVFGGRRLIAQRPTRISSGCMASSRTSTQPFSLVLRSARKYAVRLRSGDITLLNKRGRYSAPSSSRSFWRLA